MNRWLPASDLLAYFGTTNRQDEYGRQWALSPSSTIVDMIGLRRHTTDGNRWQRRLDRAIATGRLRLEFGEDLCDLIGVHPTAVWGHSYYDVCELGPIHVEYDPPEEEPDGQFCGRPIEWQATGHANYYGLYGAL